jgi:hypothetical protein
MTAAPLATAIDKHRFWLAILVIGGYLVFAACAIFIPITDRSTIFVNTVLSTMGPLVGWVIKGLFDSAATGRPGDPVLYEETEDGGMADREGLPRGSAMGPSARRFDRGSFGDLSDR